MWGAIIGGVLSAGASIYGASRASDAVEDASDEQVDLARETRDIIRQDQQPYREAGYNALAGMNTLLGLPQVSTPAGALQSGGSRGVEGPPGGLTPIPGASWRGRPVFTDSRGGIYTGRGRDWTAGDGVSYLGPASQNMRFDGTRIRVQGGGVLDYRDGEFYPGRGRRQTAIDLPDPLPGTDPATGRTYDQEGNLLDVGDYSQVEGNQLGVTGGAIRSPAEMVRQDPGYQFRLDEGMNALDASAAARGGFGTAHTRQAIRYAQGYASNEYQNLFNRLAVVAGYGQGANTTNANAAINTGNWAQTAIGNAGYTRGSAYIGGANAIGTAINDTATGIGNWWANRDRGGNNNDVNYDVVINRGRSFQ